MQPRFNSLSFSCFFAPPAFFPVIPYDAFTGQEVGRSCCLIKYRGRTIICDAGSHPGMPGMSALPYFDEVEWATVDAILITQ
jgi:L-ascorbate metabolism protein UlaG (beta-lactamase superfamily)